jgi:putative glycosyltransferase (TIGR04348 family)
VHLGSLGHEVEVVAVDESAPQPRPELLDGLARADVLVALHARRSAAAVRWWTGRHPDRPLVVALSGTDLYRDMPDDADAMASVAAAHALIVLQRAALDRVECLCPGSGEKAFVVHQSVDRPLPARRPAPGELRVVVLAHLREVKDPLLAARAARRLAPASRVTVHHAGQAPDDRWERVALGEAEANPRYTWHRELDRRAALDLLASGHALACTSVTEGGANAVTEAIAVGVPVIGTRMEGNTGLLGDDHPGLVPVGDDASLADLLTALEADPGLIDELQRRTDRLQPLTDPATERAGLADVLASLPSS